MANYYGIPTSIGIAAITNAAMLGVKINPTYFVVGDGNGTYYQPTADMTELRHEVWRGPVGICEIDPIDGNVMNFTAFIPSDVGGFTIREMGIIDDKGRLIGVANTPDVQKVQFEEGATTESELIISFVVTHPGVFEWKADPTVIIATKRDIAQHSSSAETHAYTNAGMPGVTNVAQALSSLSSNKASIIHSIRVYAAMNYGRLIRQIRFSFCFGILPIRRYAKMDAKTTLTTQLIALFPESSLQIQELLAGYTIAREDKRSSNLQKQIEAFLGAKKIDGLSTKTLKNYREMLSQFTGHVDKSVSRIVTEDIRGYIAYLADDRRLRDSSIQTHINVLRSFFSWLDAEDMIRKNPMRKIKSLKIDKINSRHALSPEEMEHLRNACRTYKEKALVEFLVSTGCRISEVTGVSLSQIDWQRRLVPVLGKGGKTRTVYFSPRAKVMLEEYLKQRKGGGALFASSRTPYGAMQPRAMQKALQQIGERAVQLRRIHPHLMRHTFATSSLNRGMDIYTIQRLLGHQSIGTTQIYAEMAQATVQYQYDRTVA